MSNNCHLGSAFDDFLEQEGILNEVTEVALKRVLAWQVEQAMKERGLTKSKMAKSMQTSRAALDRLLDPEYDSVTLRTLDKAARAVGKRIKIDLVDVI
ncbi:XRE family transcriptional regulator [Pseudanabaena sp. FACHB-1998]|uniref:helix-turn-helix domain-containing protein n=1 Tax=unclassified Pseudanabaena TaxID=2593292 RepID=UPI000B9919A6|nr:MULTISPECIES: helix-turn-helix transcriptional regulator [unclassified Pseudanabaena]MBD2177022.1 XRE family transcriptional regulator [Pseudanabaena sp. FACHB-1998]OYQ62758.1 Fis family transcriptional regulator [Pseudanabaena sp. SR411]